MTDNFDTPEDAALAGFPTRFARVIGSATQGDYSVVLLGTNEPPQLYPYQVHCYRENGQWVEGSSSNGGGWSPTGDDDIGVVTIWDEVPDGIVAVVVECRGTEHVVGVNHGHYFYAEWDYPDDNMVEGWPRVIELRRENGMPDDSTEAVEHIRLRDPKDILS